MIRTCVVLPTYNNGKMVGDVIRGVLAYCPDLIVVNDGCTDETEKVFEAFPAITVIRHERNRGKGAAMMSGFEKAREMGFERAITIDADGQHLAEEIPLFLEAAEKNPTAILVGSRHRIGPAAKMSRLANRFSDFWFWLESGASLPDTQCGFRSYPLALISRLRLNKDHYDFEVEVLIKAAWMDTPLKPVPMTALYFPPEQRVSHFDPIKDSLRIAHLFTLFFFMRFFLPSGFQKVASDRSFAELSFTKTLHSVVKDFKREAGSNPFRFSASVGLGMMMGILPIWGFQTISAALLADRLRLNKFAAVVSSNISFPLVIPFIFYAALVIGHFLFFGALDFHPVLQGTLSQVAAQKFGEWFWGSVVLAAAAGLIGALASYLLIRLMDRSRGPRGHE
jgi:glycosyltransferase involved in cell wall biosynthesis